MPPIHPPPPPLSSRLDAALRIAAAAGQLALRMRPPPGAPRASLKHHQDWLTEADTAVETLIRTELRAAFPTDGFQGEEAGTTDANEPRWVVDPIDGTSNYARGAARWCVSIGLVHHGTPILGILEAPALSERHVAVHGGGATLNGTPIRPATTADPARATVELGWSPRVPHATWLATAGRVLAAGAALRTGGSGALALADVAAGRLDAYLEHDIHLWDCAAALCILAEAGAPDAGFRPAHPHAGAPIHAAAPALAAAAAAMLHG